MFHDARTFDFVPALEASFAGILAELQALATADFEPSVDSLTTVSDGHDETGWLYFDLHGGPECEAHRARCPETARACAAVPGMLNAGFSLFRPGTHLYPHRGELPGVLRCHLPLLVPPHAAGELGLSFATQTRTWQPGHCLIFDDTFEHEAWNRGAGDRVVLLVSFSHASAAHGA